MDPAGPATSERLPPSSGPGSVVLDIGGAVGAAVVVVNASLSGAEIEIRPVGAPWEGRHVAVLERTTVESVVHAAVFGSLPEGHYEVRVRHDPDSAVANFGVSGGRVTTTHWPEASATAR
jgi:hypothetical protein